MNRQLEVPTASTELVHRVRGSVFAIEAEWRLAGDRLAWGEISDGASQQGGLIALDQIASIRLWREPKRGGARMFCRVRTRDGAGTMISSAHYAGMLKAEDRSASYREFVGALITRTAAVNPTARYVTGITPLVWWSVVLGLAGFFGALGVFLIAVGVFAVLAWRELFSTRLVVGLALVAIGAPNLIRWLLWNRPRTFDPTNPPL
jgi:hypothetical protein